jgi:serine/threonine-protein kinase RsbW
MPQPDSNASRVRLILPPDRAFLPAALACARETVAAFGLSGLEAKRFGLALEEVLINVIDHAFEDGPGEPFELGIGRAPLGVEAVILEKGIPFDPAALPAYVPPSGPETEDVRGLGLHLARTCLDELEFSLLGAEGKKTRLYKHFPPEDAPVRRLDGDRARPGRGKRRKVSYAIRPFAPGDAINIARCAWRLHGYTFYDENVYRPERIQALNAGGWMLSLIAATPDDEFVAHGALVFENPTDLTAELTYLLRDFSLRAQNCTDDIVAELFALGRARNLAGITAHVVATHSHTQRMSSRQRAVECGLELGCSQADWDFKWLEGVAAQRISEVVYFIPLHIPPARKLYPPARHRDMVRSIYGRMGAPHEFLAPQTVSALPEESTRLDVVVHHKAGNAEITVLAIGPDLTHALADQLSALTGQGVKHLWLSLDMSDPATFAAGPELEALGFFFCGAHPGTDGSDRIFLQRYSGPPIDFEFIKVASDEALEILSHIKKQLQELL